jgi:hypothetical protein
VVAGTGAGEEEPPSFLSSPTLALTKKSPKIAGGVIRLEGRGPFQALIRTDPLGIRSPGGELESGLADLDGGDADLALVTAGADDGGRRSHDLASASGKPILPQKSSNSAARSRSPIGAIGKTLGKSSRPSHATSSVMEISSSTSDASKGSNRLPERGDSPVGDRIG